MLSSKTLKSLLRLIILSIAGIYTVFSAVAVTPMPIELLALRVLGPQADEITFHKYATKSPHSEYRVVDDKGKIRIEGTNDLAMAVGLRRYLAEVCHTRVTPYAADSVALPHPLPLPHKPLSGTARTDTRFFLNYCTYGYTMPYWKWSDWERFIDWMALNGITMPLAIAGQEKVWLEVWTELGLSPESVKSYFTGPAHLP